MNNKSFNNKKEQEIVDMLRSEGKTVYSITRINTFNTCQFEYFNTYVKKKRGIGNCYSEVGSFVHDYIEKVYRDEITDTSDFTKKLQIKMMELELIDLDFPSEIIKKSFVKDMVHFTGSFEKLDGDFILEKLFVTEIDGHWFMGYIDAIRSIEDELHVIDWKTSSKFTGSKLVDAGRQLAIYKLGLESTTGMKIDKVMWNMLKYVYVCHVQKNKSIKRRMINRGKIIQEMRSAFEKEMKANGMDDLNIYLVIEEALAANSMDVLPQFIKDKYWIEDCLLDYEVSDSTVDELKSYINTTINSIENKDVDDEDNWPPLNIEKESFYCNTLCNHREICPFIKEYNRKQKFK